MKDDLADLPEEVRDAIEQRKPVDIDRLAAIGGALATKRDKAKAARKSSGVEETWYHCEEAYVGVDNANRGDFGNTKWSKPWNSDGPVTTGVAAPKDEHKATAFVRLTARYVDAGVAKLTEILFPADDKSFSFTETPLPDLIEAQKDNSQVVHDGLGGIPLMRDARPGEVPPPSPAAAPAAPAMPAQSPVAPPLTGSAAAAAPAAGAVPPAGAAGPQQVPLTVKDLAEEAIELARAKAKKAETRIYDWLVECGYPAEMRKVIFDSARIGVGVLKAPYARASRHMSVSKDGGTTTVTFKEKISPAAKWVDPWNIFPDPACGENVHNGDFIFERDYLSERQVRELKDLPEYVASQIDKVIAEGPGKNKAEDEESTTKQGSKHADRYEVWYFYGSMDHNDLDCICSASGSEAGVPAEQKAVYVIATLINDSVIRATINPLDSGRFPYHSMPWQRRAGHWAGVGVAEQCATPQKMLNAATRAMLNNAGKSAGSQIVVDQTSIKPADGSWVITPDKVWLKTGDNPNEDVRQAMMAITIPNVTDQMLKIINYALQLAEESTSIPLITQGQSGATTPDTFGAAQLQNNNANQLLRSVGYSVDDFITKPMAMQMYEWLLLDPEVPDDEKGDFQINAHGSVALVERAIQDQTIAQLAQVALNPAYGLDPKRWSKLYLKSKRINPSELTFTPEEQARIDAQPPPKDPAIQIAEIRAGVDREKIVSSQSAEQRTAEHERNIATAAQALADGKNRLAEQKLNVDHSRVQVDATMKLHELQLQRELAMLDYANKHRMNLDQVKAALAKTAMTLEVQKQLNAADRATDLHKHHVQPGTKKPAKNIRPQRSTPAVTAPLAQVPGRAPNGQSFEQGPVNGG